MILKIKKDRGWNIAITTEYTDSNTLPKNTSILINIKNIHQSNPVTCRLCNSCPIVDKCSDIYSYKELADFLLDTYFPEFKKEYPEYFI